MSTIGLGDVQWLQGPKINKNEPKNAKKGFCPKVKSPKMSLLINPRQFS